MKNKHLLMTLLMALLVPWAAMAQDPLTVYNGTNENRYVPFYGLYADDGVKCEFVIPADQLEDMAGGTISAMKFYLKSVGSTTITPSFTVFVKEVEFTTLTALTGTAGATTVFNNSITFTKNTTDVEINIPFSSNYSYGGGNLLIGVYQDEALGSQNYSQTTWYGVTQSSNTAWSGSGSGSGRKFLPKTTFTYEAASTPTSAPGVTTNQVATNITNTTVTLGGTITDMGGANSVQAGICWSTTNNPTISDGHVQGSCKSTGAYTRNITSLLPSTTYYFRAYAYNAYNGVENPTYGDIYSFTTAGNITLNQPANGTISVSVNGGTATTSSTYALEGQSVTLTATAADGYSLDCWNVTGVTGTASGNTYTFTMPSNSVTATANIVPTSGGTGTTIDWNLWERATSISTSETYLIGAISGSDVYLVLNYSPVQGGYYYSSNSNFWGYTAKATLDGDNRITGCTGNATNLQYAQWKFSAETGGTITSSYQSTRYLYGSTSSNWTDLYPNTSTTNWTYSNDQLSYSSSSYYLYLNSSYYVQRGTSSDASTVYLYKPATVTTYAITATANPSEGGSVAGSDYYANGATCTLTATPAFGYDFVSWTEGGEVVSLDAAYTFTVSGARTLIANFESQGSCIKPTDLAQVPNTLAAHQAQLSWTENSGATQWEVVYSTDSEFDPDNETPIAVNGNPTVTIPGLPQQETTYYFRVRAICGQGSQSGWSEKATFVTISGHQAPTSVSHDPATLEAHKVTITWTGVATNVLHESYDLYYSTNSVMPATLDPTTFIVGLTGNSHPLTDLISGTQYYVWVRDNCGADGYSDWSTPESFITVCEPKTITDAGWGENFNGYTGTTYDVAGVMPNCWDAYTANSYKPHVISTSSSYYNYSTTNALVMPGGSNYSYVALPEFTNDLQTLQISFKYGFYSYYYGTLNLGYIKENDVNFSTFTPFKDFTATTDRTLVESGDVYLQTLPTDAYRLAFRYDDNYGYGYYVCNIEDVVISLIPTCWQPQNLAASEVTNESAKLTWERHAMGDETAWVLQYGTDNTFATCTTVNVETNPTYTIESGLNPETTYYARVKPACDTEGNLWSEVLDFETEPDCAVPTGLAVTPGSETPYGATITWNGRNDSFIVEYGETEDMEMPNIGFETGLPSQFTTGGNYPWEVTTAKNHTDEGSYCIKSTNNAAGNGNANTVSSIELTCVASNISFYCWASCESATSYYDYGAFYIDGVQQDRFRSVSAWQQKSYEVTSGTHTFTWSFERDDSGGGNDNCFYVDDIVITGPGVSTWNEAGTAANVENTGTYTFNDATLFQPNTVYMARVKGVCGSITTDACEPVSFTTADDCGVPTEFAATAITRNSATVTWNGGFATEWKVWIRKSTEAEYPTDYATVTTASKPFDALESGTKYFVKIVPTCDETKTLEGSFTTSYAVPFVETFDANTIPDNWAKYSGSVANAFSGTNPTPTTPTYGMWDFSNTYVFGQYHASVNTYGTNCAWLATPNIDLTTVTDASKLYLLFDLALTDWNSVSPDEPGDDDQFRVLVSTDGGTTWTENNSWVWMNEGGDFVYSAIATKGQTVMLPLANYASGSVMIAFYTESGSTTSADFDVHIDNVKVGEVGTYTRTIAGYGDSEKGGYALVATPVGTVYSADLAGANMIADPAANYDLYSFDQAQADEWRNYKADNFNLTSGKGYLYANKVGTTISFIGMPYNEDGKVDLTYSASALEFPGWNLIGNPFATPATLDRPFYKMNETGDGFTAKIEDLTNTIGIIEGVFVETTEAVQATFTPQTSKGGQQAIAQTNIVISGNKGQVLDNAIIRFDGGQQLGKFSFRENSSKIFIPMEGKDYAVVNAESQTGEIPVNFKAETNGSYSLSFTSQNVTFSYLHLIDNLTGNDVDLLANPSYSFDAQTTDYAQRFRLVFATGSSVDGDSFAFINGMGNLSIFGIEGTATVQVMDVLGHVLSSESFSGSYEKQLNVAPGVYMIRLINGNDVKVQKMIVK